MKRYFYYASLIVGGILLSTSCVDDKYDLDDIDTTTSIKLNDLTVPIRLNSIQLDDVLDADEEGGLIKIMTSANGERYYAIEKRGYFEAKPVTIDELRMVDNVTVPQIRVAVNHNRIENAIGPFSYFIRNVDPSLRTLTYFGLSDGNEMEINLTVYPTSAVLTNVEIQLPQDYTATYNGISYTGLVPVEIVDGRMVSPIYVTQMQFSEPLPNIENTLDISDYIGIKSASVNSNSGDIYLSFTMSPFSANVVSGTINYNIETPEIEPVELEALPDFLKEGETSIILQNPQLYFSFGSLFGAYYNTNLLIEPMGEGTQIIDISELKFQESIIIAPDTGDLGLSLPNSSTVLVDDPQLSYILKGDRMPESISMNLYETYLDGEVTNIILGTDEGLAVHGEYTFFTPLAFAAGSQIVYQKAETDFFGDDMEEVVVSNFKVYSDVTSELPFDVTITLYPLDKDGNRIQGRNGYISASSTVGYGKSALNLEITEEFSGLDGLEYVVKTDNMDGVVLNPEQTITLDNIRATVSGEYVTKL